LRYGDKYQRNELKVVVSEEPEIKGRGNLQRTTVLSKVLQNYSTLSNVCMYNFDKN